MTIAAMLDEQILVVITNSHPERWISNACAVLQHQFGQAFTPEQEAKMIGVFVLFCGWHANSHCQAGGFDPFD